MKLVEATEEDSQRLSDYFKTTILPGHIDLQLMREASFFDIYRVQSIDFKTYFIEDEEEGIQGTASLTFRHGHLGGQKQVIGFAKDLRLTKKKRALLEWSRNFLPLIEKTSAPHDCKYIFSLISDGEHRVKNSFIHPKKARENFPRYYLFRKLDIISLHGFFPWSVEPLSSITIRRATADDVPALSRYLQDQARRRPLGPDFQEENFMDYIHQWPHLKIVDFLLALDCEQNIIGCVAPWDSTLVQRLVPVRYRGFSRTVRRVLSLGRHFGWTRPISPKGEPLNVKFLTHLCADNRDIFYALIHKAFNMAGKDETLIYPHFLGDDMTHPPFSAIYTRMRYGLYSLLPPNQPLPKFLHPRRDTPAPWIEPALI